MQEALLLAPAAIQSVALKKRWVICCRQQRYPRSSGWATAGIFGCCQHGRALMHDNDEKLSERGKRLFDSV